MAPLGSSGPSLGLPGPSLGLSGLCPESLGPGLLGPGLWAQGPQKPMTAAKKTKTAAKKTNDSSNYQSNGGNIGLTRPWALTPLGPPWVLWAFPGLPWAPLGPPPHKASPKAPEGEKLKLKL